MHALCREAGSESTIQRHVRRLYFAGVLERRETHEAYFYRVAAVQPAAAKEYLKRVDEVAAVWE
ncbi:hypothetical protein [Streptomyces katrae]|nr:hypothetical protein [Streptomyces katrae]